MLMLKIERNSQNVTLYRNALDLCDIRIAAWEWKGHTKNDMKTGKMRDDDEDREEKRCKFGHNGINDKKKMDG